MAHRASNRRFLRSTGLVAAFGAALLISGAATGEATPTDKGLELIVPDSHAELGTVYHALMGQDAQVTFTSDAPLEFIRGTSNEVIGYAIVGEGGELLAGEFLLPVESIETGIPMRNKHMQSRRWMEAETFPNVIFRIAETTDIEIAKDSDTFTTYSVTLVGDMTIKGTTREMSIPATITRMPESEQTRARFPGDLLAIRCSYPIVLSEFGVGVDDPGIIAGKLTDDLTLETRLFLTTASPEEVHARRQQR